MITCLSSCNENITQIKDPDQTTIAQQNKTKDTVMIVIENNRLEVYDIKTNKIKYKANNADAEGSYIMGILSLGTLIVIVFGVIAFCEN